MIEVPLWSFFIVFTLGVFAGCFIGWFLYSVTRLEANSSTSSGKSG
jgi:hypothetical protein